VRELADRIRRRGPIPFRSFVEAALYQPELGFFATARGAGRAGADFITSPETGPLFGACVAGGLEGWWRAQGEPDPYVVVEAGAGTGRLAREILRAEPAFLPALRYILVERSAGLRAAQRELLTVEPVAEALGPTTRSADGEETIPVARVGPIVAALDELPAGHFDGVVLANELLDNLPFDLACRSARGWDEIRVGVTADARFHEVVVPADREMEAWLADVDVPVGTRVPVQREIESWLDAVAAVLGRGFVVLLDYTVDAAGLVARADGWLRTYRAHGRGTDPLDAPGSQDITADVLLEPLRRAIARAGFRVERETTQAEWLRDLGIDARVAEGRAAWEEGAARGDLAALAGRSRVAEAAALTDPAGLGAHTVLLLSK
jgi:SAM-dependent MidA family methyltransferase